MMDKDDSHIQSTAYENKNVWDLGLLKRDFILPSRSFQIQKIARTSSPTGQRSSRSTFLRRYGPAIEFVLWIMGDLLISLEGPNDCVWGHWHLFLGQLSLHRGFQEDGSLGPCSLLEPVEYMTVYSHSLQRTRVGIFILSIASILVLIFLVLFGRIVGWWWMERNTLRRDGDITRNTTIWLYDW